jgi:tripartite-type tricarboxylate transporter receptor subunit TctC
VRHLGAVLAVVLLALFPRQSAAQQDFYKGKLITLIQDSAPGGVGQLRTQALIPVLQKHIPGNPSIVVQFMPGAGGRKAANYLYRNVRPDGLTIARVSSGVLTGAVLGLTGVEYDIEKFIYLGSGHSKGNYVFFTRREAGLDSVAKLRAARGLRIGGQSVGHSNYVVARLFAWLLDLEEPKFVVGFSGADMDLALRQGELDARANAAETVLQRTPDFVNEGKAHFHGVLEYPLGYRMKHAAFAELPAIHSFAKTERERALVRMFVAFAQFTQAFVLPPGAPADRVAILKEAFRKAWNDPEFHRNWEKMTGGQATPLMPEELEQLVKSIPRSPEDVKLYNLIAGAGSLPKR